MCLKLAAISIRFKIVLLELFLLKRVMFFSLGYIKSIVYAVAHIRDENKKKKKKPRKYLNM